MTAPRQQLSEELALRGCADGARPKAMRLTLRPRCGGLTLFPVRSGRKAR